MFVFFISLVMFFSVFTVKAFKGCVTNEMCPKEPDLYLVENNSMKTKRVQLHFVDHKKEILVSVLVVYSIKPYEFMKLIFFLLSRTYKP